MTHEEEDVMRRYIAVLLASFGFASAAGAEEFPYLPAQLQLEVHGEQALGETVAVRGTLVNFRIPADGVSLYLFYGGVNFTFAAPFGDVIVAPHVGFVPAWSESGSDAALVSLWVTGLFADGGLVVFLEADGYFADEQRGYRGFYSVAYSPVSWMNVGAHSEQLDELFTFGPHWGFTVGDPAKTNFHVNVEYHVGVQDDHRGHQLRLTTQVWWR